MNDERISNWFTTGSAATQPKEGTLFYEAVIESHRDEDPSRNDIAAAEGRPNLTLVRDDEDDLEEAILRDHAKPLDADVAMISEADMRQRDDKEIDAWPWEDEVESSKYDLAEIGVGPKVESLVSERPAEPVKCREDDHSGIEDVILCEPVGILTVEEAGELEEGEAEDTAMDPVEVPPAMALRTVNTPKRIGSGQLVPARLTWRPGDPFGGNNAGTSRFRWEVMLTSACVTAGCGLGCIWLLRTLLA